MKKTSVYLSNSSIQIATGKLHKKRLLIEKCGVYSIPGGVFTNGIITDDAKAANEISNVYKIWIGDRQSILLIIDSNMIAMKKVEMPFLSERRLLELTKLELRDITTNYKMPVFDYGVIEEHNNPGKSGLILCTAIEETIITSYKLLFRENHIGLKSLDIGVMAQIRLAKFMPELLNKTFLMAVLDERTVLTSLFIDGTYTYTKRTVLDKEGSIYGLEKELQAVWFSLLQFCQTRVTEGVIEYAYVSGFKETNTGSLMELGEHLNLTIKWMKTSSQIVGLEHSDSDLSNCLYAIGNLLRG